MGATIRSRSYMTYVVTDNCIKCKYMDCVEVCPVDCFYEGENMLVIHPDECIDCGVCEPECPAEAIFPDTAARLAPWLALNAEYAVDLAEHYGEARSAARCRRLRRRTRQAPALLFAVAGGWRLRGPSPVLLPSPGLRVRFVQRAPSSLPELFRGALHSSTGSGWCGRLQPGSARPFPC